MVVVTSGWCQVSGLAKVKALAVLARSAALGRTRLGPASRSMTRSERRRPSSYDGQVGQEVGQAGDVVAGVHDDQDAAVAGLPVPGRVSRPTTSRSWAAVTVVASSRGPRRTASSSASRRCGRTPGRRRRSRASPG